VPDGVKRAFVIFDKGLNESLVVKATWNCISNYKNLNQTSWKTM